MGSFGESERLSHYVYFSATLDPPVTRRLNSRAGLARFQLSRRGATPPLNDSGRSPLLGSADVCERRAG